MSKLRIAKLNVGLEGRKGVPAYLPDSYEILSTRPESIIIGGHDKAGWTLIDYVLPRLASGLRFGKEIEKAEPDPHGSDWIDFLRWAVYDGSKGDLIVDIVEKPHNYADLYMEYLGEGGVNR